ncbi:MAG TPA: F0F1 ATP synthase subunit delta [Verrucomicrobiales bacterium]|jgi:F-type H+-transporting ATPase subunit delta|nr:F0F1 ATP synthase subunit delta [Verrucomicrobiales bacterium]
MKVSKEAQRTARQLFRLTTKDGKVNEKTARKIVAKITEEKPRHYLGILTAYHRMLRLEAAKRHAIVESASSLSNEQCDEIRGQLQKAHGKDLTAEFHLNSELIGGMRVKLGSTVWDGSVKSRLDNLRSALLA